MSATLVPDFVGGVRVSWTNRLMVSLVTSSASFLALILLMSLSEAHETSFVPSKDGSASV